MGAEERTVRKNGTHAPLESGEGVASAREKVANWKIRVEEWVDDAGWGVGMAIGLYAGMIKESGGRLVEAHEAGELVGLGLMAAGVVVMKDVVNHWANADFWKTVGVGVEALVGWGIFSAGLIPVEARVKTWFFKNEPRGNGETPKA